MYDRARIYDTIRGQFLGEDPLSDVMKGRIGIKSLYVYVRNHPLQFYDPYGYQATSVDDVCSWRSGQNGELCPPDCTTKFTRVGDPWCDCPPPSQRKQRPRKKTWCGQNIGECIQKCFIAGSPPWSESLFIAAAGIVYTSCSIIASVYTIGLVPYCIHMCTSDPCSVVS